MIVKRIATIAVAIAALVVVPAAVTSAQEIPEIPPIVEVPEPISDLLPPPGGGEEICVENDDNLEGRICVPISDIEFVRFVVQTVERNT